MPAARAANEATAAKSALINDVRSMDSFVLFRRGDVTFDPRAGEDVRLVNDTGQEFAVGLHVHTTANECQWRPRIAWSCDLPAASQASLLSKFAVAVEEPE
jgi:hypothetical protein